MRVGFIVNFTLYIHSNFTEETQDHACLAHLLAI